MPFPKRFLHDREELVLDLRPHLWFIAGPAAVLALSLVALVWVAAFADLPDWVTDWGTWAVAGVTVVGLAWFAGRYAKWATTNFVVTSDRIIYRSGVVAKKGIEIPLERVNTIFSSQSVIERLLGSGDLVIESAGESGRQTFADIKAPIEVQNEIYRQIEGNQQRMFKPAAPAEPDAIDQLSRLDQLRQQGVISEEEFQLKKADLLDRM